MPNATVPAAARGLPKFKSRSDCRDHDFHLDICARIAALAAEESSLESEEATLPQHAGSERIFFDSAIDAAYARRRALILALAAEPAQSLGAAAVQIAAACQLHSIETSNDAPDPDIQSAIERLIQSSARALTSLTALSDDERAGISHLMAPHLDVWAGVHERIAAVKAQQAAGAGKATREGAGR